MLKWKELYEECAGCHKCILGNNRTNMVFGDGNPRADIIFIGEAPGADEDRTGVPFIGRAGQLLTKYLEELNLYRKKDYYICNVCKCRPEKNRTPYEDEAKMCLPYVRNQVALVKPKIIVCLGATAMRYVLGADWRITRDRGKWVEKKGFYMTATFHPSAILRDANKNDLFLEDLKNIDKKYREISA
ncbi:MAG: uracil-DNA glycosylase [Clostridium sp.]|uniref:uracil-DNA glycosylase n=1 Tax=Clostridium sp. TaxID=1506 RepID=UPI0025C40EE1|nr:uracil-DNA glycosylase [Clostridium sp.]MCH3965359.1 uracil-DNA glycosylase [Clostridium sp.]MCI1714580.1 uracil-DNA glycosylase [Clostridium sp.]MCI1798842.1 uracil-DNA glycosylase [Clostridium sp.]MCI1812427.1 uracil-DNA glycosylase [Clostridium sp.]MCI1869652.1 uracil-DNA glycosylase [Clostridium sp.]